MYDVVGRIMITHLDFMEPSMDPVVAINLLKLAAAVISDEEIQHRTPEVGGGYNFCDESPCDWCRMSRHFLSEVNRLYGITNPPNPQDHPGRSPRVHPVVGPLSDTEQGHV
jgi:hypothetical protein